MDQLVNRLLITQVPIQLRLCTSSRANCHRHRLGKPEQEQQPEERPKPRITIDAERLTKLWVLHTNWGKGESLEAHAAKFGIAKKGAPRRLGAARCSRALESFTGGGTRCGSLGTAEQRYWETVWRRR